eukprot:scaffold205432_cov24-Tisochrysis_lutea.AAC.3
MRVVPASVMAAASLDEELAVALLPSLDDALSAAGVLAASEGAVSSDWPGGIGLRVACSLTIASSAPSSPVAAASREAAPLACRKTNSASSLSSASSCVLKAGFEAVTLPPTLPPIAGAQDATTSSSLTASASASAS